jgi:ubiquinone/menaquinone biosynthesis C-methylase UbiE
MSDLNSTNRFSDRAANYARHRPTYPAELLQALIDGAGLTAESIVADAGSGTGISAEPFLRYGCTVYGVEPNADMRAMAEAAFSEQPRFRSVAGSAEATTLPDRSVDLVTVAQAFHWLDRARARKEFARILRPGGQAAIFWNFRRTGGTPFLDGYEAMLDRFGTDYAKVKDRYQYRAPESLRAFFGGPYESRQFEHSRLLELEEMRGLLQSASYVPARGAPTFPAMMEELDRIFAATQRDGRIELIYDTELYFGRIQ